MANEFNEWANPIGMISGFFPVLSVWEDSADEK